MRFKIPVSKKEQVFCMQNNTRAVLGNFAILDFWRIDNTFSENCTLLKFKTK
jgi:hypothetical protein